MLMKKEGVTMKCTLLLLFTESIIFFMATRTYAASIKRVFMFAFAVVPSFWATVKDAPITARQDLFFGMERTEVLCARF